MRIVTSGDKIRCTGLGFGVTQLTVGEVYTVLAGDGETDLIFRDTIERGFNIRDDEGDLLYCCLEDCGHGSFEIVE